MLLFVFCDLKMVAGKEKYDGFVEFRTQQVKRLVEEKNNFQWCT